jgi:carotenoid cleavage dioxygenase-like enzyme
LAHALALRTDGSVVAWGANDFGQTNLPPNLTDVTAIAASINTNSNLVGGFAPIQMECDAPDLVIEGEVPRELNGTFYRNGPNPQFAPRGQHHWFGGDGMVHAFTVLDGRVAYRNRWARTIKWKLEHEAGVLVRAGHVLGGLGLKLFQLCLLSR